MDAANFRYPHAEGDLFGYITEAGVRTLLLPHPEKPLRPYLPHSAPNKVLGHHLRAALDAYFAGIPQDFADIALDFEGATPFQRAVWNGARRVPHGTTSTYGALARDLGRPASAARAVGAALGANPLAILVPCHRFLAANGGLTGYAAGLEWKRRLLRIEGAALV